ncbi:lytic transglycosylase domain-containing protein [Streptomyces sp. NPDC086091]|uniref:lytic transglycosylase domain-containing protein n=1 Tax=Streptomyces sp. NPDC086091 TaxID=3365751 RepID=UPI003821F1B9
MSTDGNNAPSGGSGVSTAVKAAAAAGGCGCLSLPLAGVVVVIAPVLIIGGLAILLLPLVILFLIFNGLPLGSIGNTSDLSLAEQFCEAKEQKANEENPEDVAARTEQIVLGDGLGLLELSNVRGSTSQGFTPCTVPENLFDPIVEAGSVCDVIGPVTIAAQIQYESRFAADFVGPNGARGISQVPAAEFTRLAGEDADPLDPETSIAAQGDYLCELAEQTQQLLDTDQAEGNVLDLTLAAYDAGIDAVRQARGVPGTEESQSYVIGVRTWFAPMEGLGPPPRTYPADSGLFDS